MSSNKLFPLYLQACRRGLVTRSIPIPQPQCLRSNGNHVLNKAFSTTTTRSAFLKIDSRAARQHPNLYRIPADPVVAATRVSQLLERASFEDAKEYLINLRSGLQSTAAWNTLLKYCVTHGRGQLGESCFTEMRRRGFVPNEKTYTLMVLLWSKSKSPSALANAETWFSRIEDPTLFHYNALLRVYKDKGVSMNKALNRLEAMSIVPNDVSYSTVLQCAKQGDAALVIEIWQHMDKQWSTQPSRKDGSEHSLLAQKARRVLETEQGLQDKPDDKDDTTFLDMDDTLQRNLFSAMTRASCRPSFAMQVIERLYGIQPPPFSRNDTRYQPSEAVTIQSMGLVPSVRTLDVILRFFGNQKSYKLGRKYYKLMLDHFPQLTPDDHLKQTAAWLEPRKSFWAKQQGRTSSSSSNRN